MARLPSLRNLLSRRSSAPADLRPQTHDFSALIGTINGLAAGGGLPRDPRFGAPFGPGLPDRPSPLDPDGDPRLWQYPVSWNQSPGAPHTPFTELREAARSIDMVRRCVEMRKKEITSREWGFRVSSAAINREALKSPNKPKQDVRQDLTEKHAEQISRLEEFWEHPGRSQDLDWEGWVFASLEEYLVLDAWVVYPRKTLGGETISLDLVDGSTIKPLLDNRGAKPAYPHPAYQQDLHGASRGEFAASFELLPSGEKRIPNAFTANQLYYIRRHTRVDSPYGFSAVEQALISARLYLRRQGWMLDEYDDGTLPRAWIKSMLENGAVEMDPTQRRIWEDALNDELSGNTAARHRLKVLPPGMEAEESSSADERYKPDYDLFLIKLLASHFDVPISELGFSEARGLGSSGWSEGQEASHERTATLPDTRWFSRNVTRISREQLDCPVELEHYFLGIDEEDEAVTDEIWGERVKGGRATINEARARLDLPLLPFPEANMPMWMTDRGVVFLDGASKLAPSGTMIQGVEYEPNAPQQIMDPSSGRPMEVPGPSGRNVPANQVPKAKEIEPGTKPTAKPAVSDKLAELTAFRRWTKRNPEPSRPFEFKHLTPDDAPDLADDPRVTWS